MPTLDAAGTLGPLLDALQVETATIPAEILVVDSSSTDSTADVARKAGARVEVIPRMRFGHGRTRNWAASLITAPFIAYLTQDALPQEGWLASILKPFEDSQVAGVYGRQVPRPGAYAFEAARIRRAFPPVRHVFSAELGSAATTVPFSNVNSCVRRTVLERIPFPDVEFAEDATWAAEVLKQGGTIVYEPAARVLHSHSREKYISGERQAASFRSRGAEALGHAPFVALPIVALLNTLRDWDAVRDEGHGLRTFGQGYADALAIEVRKWRWTKSQPR